MDSSMYAFKSIMPELYKLPVERFSPKDKDSFAYKTVVKRWPTILSNIISTLSSVNDDLTSDPAPNAKVKLEEGKMLIAKVSELKYQLEHNAILQPIVDDGGGNIACYNDELATYVDDEKRWYTMNWLFAECYLYRRLRSFFALTELWKEYDPFFSSKAETYRSSSGAIIHLARALNALITQPHLSDNYEQANSPLEVAFLEMIQADLWGNATDLSLLVDLKYEDLQKLQAVGRHAQEEQAKLILRNDLPKVWELIKTVKNGRVDFVMDNAGFEVYTDFILADFLLITPFVSEIIFHPKAIPWFVSDVLPYDFQWAITSLLDSTFFNTTSVPLSTEDKAELSTLALRWKSHLDSGRFKLSVPIDTKLGSEGAHGFWTTQFAYQDLPAIDPELLKDLQNSDLVIFKGDLNYRKLIGDAKWPTTTPFEEALGPLAGKFNLLSLRTNKADTICGLPEGIETKLEAEDPSWRVSGKFAVVSFCPKQ